MKKNLFKSVLLGIGSTLMLTTSLLLSGANVANAQANGYVFSQSNGTFASISTSGSLLDSAYYASTTNTLDTKGWSISLPFTFTFNGQPYSSIYANSNGGATFGTTTSTSSSVISSAEAFAGSLGIMNRDLWGVYGTGGNITSGSNVITGVTSFYGLTVGATLQGGTGIVANSTVTAFDAVAGTITMSANATATTSGISVRWGIGKIYTQTTGVAPNRKFIIEWRDFADYNVAATNNETRFSFQVVLNETSNVIDFVYGTNSFNSTTSRTNQVGLRGSTNADYNNRTGTSWTATTAGTSNSTTLARTNAVFPASGLTFTWSPPTCFAPASLTSNSVTSASANIAWVAPGSAPANGYEYYYSTSNTAPVSSTVASGQTPAGTTSAAISLLTPSTIYYFWVRSVCSTSDKSAWSLGGTFTTLCLAFTAPFTESFSGGALPTCWANTNNTNSTSAYLLWLFSGGMDYGTTGNGGKTSGTFAWVDASSPYNLGDSVILVSPQLNLTGLTAPYVEFEWFKSHLTAVGGSYPTGYTNNRFSVDVNSGSGWNTIFSDTSNSTIWRTVGIVLPSAYLNATIQLRFIVNKNTGNGYFYDNVALDEIKVQNAPSCLVPLALTSNTITNVTANIAWSAPSAAPAGGYEYYYSTTNTSPTASTVASGATIAGVTTASLTTLTPNTTYYFWVRSVCSASNKSDWTSTPGVFTTQLVVPRPWTEGFTTTTTPLGFDITGWAIGSTRGVTGNPGNNIYKNLYGSATTGTFSTVNVGAVVSGDVFSFDYKTSLYSSPYGALTAGSGYFRVFISTNFGNTYTQIDSVPTPTVTAWLSKSYPLTAYAGQNVKIRIDANWIAQDYDLAFDNLFIGAPPTCFMPTAIVVNSTTNVSASVSWTAASPVPANGYEIYYDITNTAPTATSTPNTVSSTTSATLNSLTPTTTYYVWIRSVCSSSDKSAWQTGPSFTTQLIVPRPWTEGFTNTTTPAGFDNTGWTIGSARGVTGNPGNNLYKNIYGSVTTGTFNTVNVGTIVAGDVFSFDYKTSLYSSPYNALAAGSGHYKVFISTNFGSTYTEIDSVATPTVNTWLSKSYPLTAYVGQNVKIRIVANWTAEDWDIAFDNLFIGVPPCTPPVVNLGNDTTLCTGSTLTLNAGNAGATYLWNNAATTQTRTITTAGTYWVDVTNGTCTTRDSIVVTAASLPTVSLGNDTAICIGASLSLNAGNAGAAYLWDNSATTQTRTVTAGGTYHVRVTNSTGCIGRDTIVVTTNALPVVNLGADTGFCAGGSYTLDAGNAGATYSWSNAATTQTTSVTAAGTYSVTVTNTNGCIGRDTVVVEEYPLLTVDLGNDTVICADPGLTLDATITGGTYEWDDASTNATRTITAAGTYHVVVTNSNGCTGTDTITVTLVPAASGDLTITPGSPEGNYSMSISNGANISSVAWAFGDSNTGSGVSTSHQYNANGTYTVTAYLINACGDTTVISRTVDVTTLGIGNLKLSEQQLTLYPNPATSIVTVSNKSGIDMLRVKAFNVLGQQVYSAAIRDSKSHQINITEFASGVYTLRIETAEGVVVRKFEVLK